MILQKWIMQHEMLICILHLFKNFISRFSKPLWKNSSWGGELKQEIHIFKIIFLIVLSDLFWHILNHVEAPSRVCCSTAWFSFLIQFWSQKRFNTKQMKTDVTMTRSFIKAGDVYTTGSYYSAHDTVSDRFRGFLHALISSWRKLWTHQQSSLELYSFFLFSLERLTGRRMSLFLFTFPTSLVFFPPQLYKVKPSFTIQVIVHTASKNNISTARQSSLWCNRSPKARMAHNDSLCNVQTDSHYFSCSLSLSLSWRLSFHTPWIFLRITPWFIWKCGFSRLISGVC